jgi:hypothetical protein
VLLLLGAHFPNALIRLLPKPLNLRITQSKLFARFLEEELLRLLLLIVLLGIKSRVDLVHNVQVKVRVGRFVCGGRRKVDGARHLQGRMRQSSLCLRASSTTPAPSTEH